MHSKSKQKPYNHFYSSAHSAHYWHIVKNTKYPNADVYLLASSVPRLIVIHPSPPSNLSHSGKTLNTQSDSCCVMMTGKVRVSHPCQPNMCSDYCGIPLSSPFQTSKWKKKLDTFPRCPCNYDFGSKLVSLSKGTHGGF